jgi:hypothetical protein
MYGMDDVVDRTSRDRLLGDVIQWSDTMLFGDVGRLERFRRANRRAARRSEERREEQPGARGAAVA